MIVDFQHHYVPEQLARQKGLYSDKVTVATEGGSAADDPSCEAL